MRNVEFQFIHILRINVNYIRSWLTDFRDQTLCELLEFWFPTGFNGGQILLKQTNTSENWKLRNNKGVQDFPKEMNEYLRKAIAGPF